MTDNGTLCVVDKRSLEHLASRFRESEQRTNILREELASAIHRADADGVPQKDICEVTGYTRQQIRRIVIAEKERMADADKETAE
jgi:predicted transcriptional regulator